VVEWSYYKPKSPEEDIMKKKTSFCLLFLLIAISVVLIAFNSMKSSNTNNIKNGVLDLSSWDQSDTLALTGNAEFYWGKLLTEQDFAKNIKPDFMPKIPSVWNYYPSNGDKLPGEGYGTYRIHVVGAIKGQILSMRIQPCSTAYEVFIDDALVASCGIVGTSRNSTSPLYAIRVVKFTPKSESFDIIYRVSNYTYARGGLWYPTYLGTPEQIDSLSLSIFGRDVFAIGFFTLIIIYNLFYCFLRKDKKLVLFIIMCLLLICRTVVFGSYLINFTFPAVPYRVFVFLEYTTICFLPSVCLMLVYQYYLVGISKTAIKISMGLSIVFMTLNLILPTYVFTNLTYIIQAFGVIVCSYGLWKLICAFSGNKFQDKGMLLIILGLIAVLLSTARDIMYDENIISGGHMEYMPVGFILLVLFWNLSFSYKNETVLRHRLKVISELNEANERERMLELKLLKSQIHPRFIHDALETVASVSKTDVDRAKYLLCEFSNYLRSCYDIGKLENLLPIENELSLVHAYAALEQARYGDNLSIEYSVDDISIEIPPLILQPLVENVITHNEICDNTPLHLLVYVRKVNNLVIIGVRDDGAGFDQEQIPVLLSNDLDTDGVGIYSINKRLLKLYNMPLRIENLDSGGADVYMTIPYTGN
jgi:two-component system, LytTR family, sensor kinase